MLLNIPTLSKMEPSEPDLNVRNKYVVESHEEHARYSSIEAAHECAAFTSRDYDTLLSMANSDELESDEAVDLIQNYINYLLEAVEKFELGMVSS